MFLNNITININNKLTKTLKKNRKKSLKTKNKFYVLRKSRVELYITFYFFILFLDNDEKNRFFFNLFCRFLFNV